MMRVQARCVVWAIISSFFLVCWTTADTDASTTVAVNDGDADGVSDPDSTDPTTPVADAAGVSGTPFTDSPGVTSVAGTASVSSVPPVDSSPSSEETTSTRMTTDLLFTDFGGGENITGAYTSQEELVTTDISDFPPDSTAAVPGSTTAVPGSTTAISGSTTAISGSTTTISGSTTAISDSTPDLTSTVRVHSAPITTTPARTTTTTAVTTTTPTTTLRFGFCSTQEFVEYKSACKPCSDFGQNPCGQDLLVNTTTCSGDLINTMYCLHTCMYSRSNIHCCQGFWGDDCQECPGGIGNVCNGRGVCSPLGECECQADFKGTACEQCADDNRYGPNCQQNCTCINGQCNNGVDGNGFCTCNSGYTGVNCDKVIRKCEDLKCYTENITNWRCVDVNGSAACNCSGGYRFDDETTDCVAIDPCQEPAPPCGTFSRCLYVGPGKHTCECVENYRGDGTICLAIDPCQTDHGGCENNTSCLHTGPNKHKCVCKFGYENYRPQVGCSLKDYCDFTSCHKFATCETVEPFKIRCTCKEGYAGNGDDCYGNIYERIRDINSVTRYRMKNDLDFVLRWISRTYLQALQSKGPFTIFVPMDKNFRAVGGFDKLVSDPHRSRQVLRQHILIGKFTIEELIKKGNFYTLQGNQAEFRVRENIGRFKLQGSSARAIKILKKNIPASNGMIHVVNNLLTMQPTVSGDPQKSALDVIKKENVYNTFEMMVEAAGLVQEFNKTNVTIFAPTNEAWNTLSNVTLNYLLQDTVEGKAKLGEVLRNHIFPGVINVTDLIERRMITSRQGVNVLVRVNSYGQIQLDNKVTIQQVNVPCRSDNYYYHIDSLLVPSYLGNLSPNYCNVQMSKKAKGPCEPCPFASCSQPTDTPTDDLEPCYFRFFQRCTRICIRQVEVPTCCSGFYGPQCQPCPGGFRTPCNGKGKCLDTLTGPGTCLCDPAYKGVACQLCQKNNVFGPGCNQTCTCLNGECDDGPNGNGKCKPGTCRDQYMGDNCDQKLVQCGANILLCHAHAFCYVAKDNTYSCKCKLGYESDGTGCRERNPCEEDTRGGCHPQATCTKIGPGANKCICQDGWMGDGFYCAPKTPCLNNSNCDPNAACQSLSVTEYRCFCNIGYRGNGSSCELVNPCLDGNNGGCHPKAICTSIKFGEKNCTCPKNMYGDGFSCYGTIFDEVMSHPNLTKFAAFMKLLKEKNNFLKQFENKLTLLAPSDSAMEAFYFGLKSNSSHWRDEINVLNFISFHTLTTAYTTEKFKSMEKVLKSYPTLYDGFSIRIINVNKGLHIFVNHSDFAQILVANITAGNGYIHIVDKVLEVFFSDSDTPSLEDTLSQEENYSLFYQALNESDVLNQLQSMDEFTVFVPNNSALKSKGSLKSGDLIKNYVVPSLIFTPSVLDMDTVDTLLGSRNKLIFNVYDDKVYVNNVKIIRSDVLFDGGVIHVIEDLIRPVLSRCDSHTANFTRSECRKCPTNDTTACPAGFEPVDVQENIWFECNLTSGEPGCQLLCYTNQTEPECCMGYFGPTCKECPGGAEDPCSGHGNCSDGVDGTGVCACDSFYGGQDCSQCQGPAFKCDTAGCGPENCSDSAVCVLSKCICKDGYYGNGTWCEKINNPCTVNNGGCDPDRAKCIFRGFTPPDVNIGRAECVCVNGTVGNGTFCSRDILDAISRIRSLKYFYNWMLHDAVTSNISTVLQQMNQSITLFLPLSQDWQKLNFSSLMVAGKSVQIGVNSHLSLLAVDGETINITVDNKGQVFANKILVVEKNIQTLNGVLHLTAAPIIEYQVIAQTSASRLFNKTRTTTIVVCLVLVAMVGLLVVAGIIVYKKQYYKGFLNIFKRSDSGSESNLSFARLSAQEEDDDSLKDTAKYDNPIFNDPDIM
ncbi:stabilin-2-like [Physella acuta]|uniref:stabilin-2-like n=1 Tax=Physella acuta TaxID=109671 RepID=UPI0027DB2215|nr:stabilin-2-like [Physella acuta]